MGYIYYHGETAELDSDEEKNFVPKTGKSKFLIEKCRCIGSKDFLCGGKGNKLWRPALILFECEEKRHKVILTGTKNKTKITIECYGNLIV